MKTAKQAALLLALEDVGGSPMRKEWYWSSTEYSAPSSWFVIFGNGRERSTEVVRLVAEHVKGELPIIASGGVMSGADAVEKMEAGAQLVQLFTGFIYKGPALIAECSEAVAAWRRAQEKR